MKDFMMIWNRFAGQRYSSVNQRPTHQSDSSESEEITISQNPGSLRKKSSIFVNRFFDAAVPVHADGRRWPKSIFTLMTLGFLGLVSGCFILIFHPYDVLFKLKAVLAEGGETFEMWRKPNVDLYLKVYLFNVTNHEEYLSGKTNRLSFQEVGPYVYKEDLEHGNIKFNDNGTLTTVPIHPLTYVPEMSNGTEEDLLILPNIALLSITNVMKDASYVSRWGLSMLIRQTDSHPLVRMTAREFMFGYDTTLVTLGNNLMPSWIKFDKLGLIDRMYDFEGDYETVYTGETDIRLSGLIEKYNGDTNLPQWTGSCANVRGASDGAKFPSRIGPNDTILFFRKSLCRSERMVRIGEETIKGLHTYRYKFMENELDNGAYNPENKCFCRNGKCLKPGLIDVADCYYGFPIALSYPHFYKSDPSILASIDGLQPDKDLHETYAYIQPQSGLPVRLAFRFQINMVLENIGHMARVERFENVTLPLLWFEISMNELPEPINTRFWLYLNVLPLVEEAMKYIMFVSGTVFIIWSVLKILLYRPKGTTTRGQWLEMEMEKKRMQFMNNRRGVGKTNEMETYYSSLLGVKKPTTMDAVTANLPSLKQETV